MREVTGIPKSLLSYGMNGKTNLTRKTITKIEYWMKHNRPHPMLTVNSDHEFCCSKCLEIFPLELRCKRTKDNDLSTYCRKCHRVTQKAYRENHHQKVSDRKKRYMKNLRQDPKRHGLFLEKKSDAYYKRNYGEYADCAKLVFNIRRKLNVQKSKC